MSQQIANELETKFSDSKTNGVLFVVFLLLSKCSLGCLKSFVYAFTCFPGNSENLLCFEFVLYSNVVSLSSVET